MIEFFVSDSREDFNESFSLKQIFNKGQALSRFEFDELGVEAGEDREVDAICC